MSLGTLTLIVVLGFVGILFGIAYLASRSNVATPDDYIVGGRSIGTIVLLMTMGATYFSTWTLLGAFGSYYRSGGVVYRVCSVDHISCAVYLAFRGQDLDGRQEIRSCDAGTDDRALLQEPVFTVALR